MSRELLTAEQSDSKQKDQITSFWEPEQGGSFEPRYLFVRVEGLALQFVAPDEQLRLRLQDVDGLNLEIYGRGDRSDALILLAIAPLPTFEFLAAQGGRWKIPIDRIGLPGIRCDVACTVVDDAGVADDEGDHAGCLPCVELCISHSFNELTTLSSSRQTGGLPLLAGGRGGALPYRHASAALLVLLIVALSGLAYQTGRLRERQPTQAFAGDGAREIDSNVVEGITSRSNQPGFGSSLRLPNEAGPVPASLTLELADINADARERARVLRWQDSVGSDPIQYVASTRTLRVEIVEKELNQALIDAQGYVLGGALNGNEKAVQIYTSVLERLTPKARSALHQPTLASAMAAKQAGRLEEAALRFQALFADFILTR